MKQALVGALVFFPSTGGVPAPPGVTDVVLTAEDGVRLHAFHAVVDPAAPTLLWSHGNAGHASDRLPVLLALRELGLNVLAYDYRGYGRSDAVRPTEDGVYRDARAALRHLRAAGVPAARTLLFGESLGGAVSLALAVEEPVAGVALVSTFSSLRDVARVHYGPLGWLAGDAFDSSTRVAALDVPVLVVHGTDDEIIPAAQGRALAAAARRGRFIAVPGGTHNDMLGRPAVVREIAAFARAVAR